MEYVQQIEPNTFRRLIEHEAGTNTLIEEEFRQLLTSLIPPLGRRYGIDNLSDAASLMFCIRKRMRDML